MDQGGNYWTLFTPGIWKVLHAVLHHRRKGLAPVGISGGLLDADQKTGRFSLDQNDSDGVLSREILVKRSDADASPAGDGVRRIFLEPSFLQYVSRRFHNDIDGGGCAGLGRLFSWA
jgi:hypothetical protein